MRDKLTREYSQRLGQLTGEQLQAALDRFSLGTLLDAEPATRGLFGQNVFLTSTLGRFVLRGCPHTDSQLPKERFVARLIHERTSVPAPWPYLVEESPAIFGWSFAIMPRLPGQSGGSFSSDEGQAIATGLGEGLARLHALRWEEPGYYDVAVDSIRPYPVPHGERIVAQVSDWLERCRSASDATHEEDAEWVEAVVASGRSRLDEPFPPVWVHHDFRLDNVLMEPESGGWRMCGIVDLNEGYFGDAEEDLVRTIADFSRQWVRSVQEFSRRGPENARRFVDAYRARQPLRAGFAERYRIYQLLDCLVIWEYGQHNRVWFPEGLRFRSFAEPFVDLDPFPTPARRR